MEEEIKLVKLMDHKEAYRKFENDLLELLPADQPKFIELLQAKDVISRETKKKMDVPNRTRELCVIAILEEIGKSIESSDPEKFDKLLSVMEEYNPVLEELAKQIKNKLDPVGTPYVHETMKEYLSRNLFSLSKLPYKEMKLQLLSRKIITFEDIRRNECMYGDNMMRMVLDTMQRGLAFKVTKYFKQFLEIMEESNNPVWQRTAEKLGGSKRIPDSGEVTTSKAFLIPVGHTENIQCNGKDGGSYLWKGHDFEMILPPGCADGTVNISLQAYLPSSPQKHCLASAMFEITTNVEEFKKPITLKLPHWANIKSEKDKEKLCFLICWQKNYLHRAVKIHEVQKGSFEVGESLGCIDVSKVHQICICKKFAAAKFEFRKADYQFHDDLGLTSFETDDRVEIMMNWHTAEVDTAETWRTGFSSLRDEETIENKYLDMLFLPDHHKWAIYCIALDNPTYLQAIMKCFESQNQINSSIKLLKRQVEFYWSLSSYKDTPVTLCLVDPEADGHIIKLFRDKKISMQEVDFLGLTALNFYDRHFETNFPSWCTLHIIGELSASSSILTVHGLCGINGKSTDFSLISPTEPTEHGCQFESYQHIPPEIIKKTSNSQLPEVPAPASVDSHSSLANINLFISYAWEGATNDFVEKLKHDLEATGLEIFLDKHEILPGDNIQREVARGMDKANGIIIVYSERYPNSEWCNKELQMAERLKKPIFPVRLITDPYQSNVDLALGSILYVKFSLDDHDQYQASLEFLIKGIKKKDVLSISENHLPSNACYLHYN